MATKSRFEITRFLALCLRELIEHVDRMPMPARKDVGIFIVKTDHNGCDGIMHGPECGYDFLAESLQNPSTKEVEIRVESWLPGTNGVPDSYTIRAEL